MQFLDKIHTVFTAALSWTEILHSVGLTTHSAWLTANRPSHASTASAAAATGPLTHAASYTIFKHSLHEPSDSVPVLTGSNLVTFTKYYVTFSMFNFCTIFFVCTL